MASVKFVIAGKPKGKDVVQGGFTKNRFPDPGTKKEMDLVRLLAVQAMGGRQPFIGPVEIKVMAWFPIPDSWPKKKKAAALSGELIPTVKPDFSNILKLVEDAIHPPPPPKRKKHEHETYYDARHRAWEKIKVIIVDDKQIADCHGWKRYSDNPRVVVEVTELRPEP